MRILVVEDERLLCDGIAEDLRLEKYTVDCCYNGAAACERLFVEPYDLVVLDLNLPGMDGLELAKRIREKYDFIVCVILSGHNDFAYAKEAIQHQVMEYLLKPVNDDELSEVLRKIEKNLLTFQEEFEMANNTSFQKPENHAGF